MLIELLDPTAWDQFTQQVEELVPTEDQLRRALGTTCKRMSDWLRTRAVRALSPELGIPQKLLRSRFKSFRLYGDVVGGKAWFGLNGLPFTDLQPELATGGIRTKLGGYYEKEAFLTRSRKRGGRLLVLKRQGKTWVGKNKRGPVDFVRADIEERCLNWLQTSLNRPEFERVFYERLERELKWRMSL